MILHGIRTLLLSESVITSVLPIQTVNRISFPAIFCDSPVQGFVPPLALLIDEGQDPMTTLSDPTFGFRNLTLEIDVWSYSEPEARSITNTIRTFFDDYHGAAGSYTVKAVNWRAEAYNYVRVDEGRDTRFHVGTTTYLVQYTDP